MRSGERTLDWDGKARGVLRNRLEERELEGMCDREEQRLLLAWQRE